MLPFVLDHDFSAGFRIRQKGKATRSEGRFGRILAVLLRAALLRFGSRLLKYLCTGAASLSQLGVSESLQAGAINHVHT